MLNKTDDEQFDKFVERLYNEITVHDLNIIEDYSDIKASVRDDIVEMGEDTVTFLNNYVDQLETDVNKKKLKEYLKSFYIEQTIMFIKAFRKVRQQNLFTTIWQTQM